MTTADGLRLLTLLIVLLAISSFPAAIWRQGRQRSAWLAVAGCEGFMFIAALGVTDRWGHPILWYRTPLTFISASLVWGFSLYVLIKKDN